MLEIPDSILDVTKLLVGIDPEDDSFDVEIITHINTAFFTLNQLGIGPEEGFTITDNTSLWYEFMGTDFVHAVKSYMGLKVKMLFDPPATGPAMASMERIADQMEWRLQVKMEGVRWVAASNSS